MAESLSAVIERIITDFYPNEREVFGIMSDTYLSMALAGQKPPLAPASDTMPNEFAPDQSTIEFVLKSIPLIWGVVKAIREMRRAISPGLSDAEARLKRILIEEGLPTADVESILAKYSDQILKASLPQS